MTKTSESHSKQYGTLEIRIDLEDDGKCWVKIGADGWIRSTDWDEVTTWVRTNLELMGMVAA